MDTISIKGARENNLQNIDIDIPRNQLVVITGLSGSGKSSLAFNTIHAEGQRRYMETFSAYARNFVGNMERPDVDSIDGLSPVIAIEQKTTNKNPRSTVGTITEVYDFLRLLFARVADAYSHVSGERMVHYTEEQIIQTIETDYADHDIMVLAPVVKRRKGHYRELFVQIAKKGFLRVRVDGEVRELTVNMQVDRYKVHDIEVVVDRLRVKAGNPRLKAAIQTAFKMGKGVLMILDNSLSDNDSRKIRHFSRLLMDPVTGLSYPEPEPNTFSFNSPYGACPKCNGLGEIAEVDLNKLIPDRKKSIRQGAFEVLGKYSSNHYFYKQLELIGRQYGFTIDDPVETFSTEALNVILYGTSDFSGISSDMDETSTNGFQGIVNYILQTASEESSAAMQKWANSFMNAVECPACHGHRLRPESLAFKIDGKNIGEMADLDIDALLHQLDGIEERIDGGRAAVAHEILNEIRSRLQFMVDVGTSYLSLNRSTRSLSGGESQRIRLATQIGARLVNVLYILDEPSIGLHQRDNQKLIDTLKSLRDIGNSVIVVEHDRDMMLNADYLIDIGPGAGVHGGKVIYAGPVGTRQLAAESSGVSLTLDYLSGRRFIAIPKRRLVEGRQHLIVEGATGNNLKGVTLDLPLGVLVCVTGVSGSGKSTLINETLQPLLSQRLYRSDKKPLPYTAAYGLEAIDKVIQIDQSPIGRSPRSNPATYVGIFDDIRRLFAELPSARIRGYKAGHFSFNVSGGRCEHCKGAGVRTIEMHFLPDVYVGCEVCNGKRYNRETLEIRYKGKSIADVLDMTIDDAVDFFSSYPRLHHKLKTLQEVGLGYIRLGQQSTTLSGGEAQRIKLSTELARTDTGKTLYILDEPTTGLHFEDIRALLDVLGKLVDRGNSVVVIEHNLDVVKVADWIIDMGPEGGRNGGQIVFAGTPEQLANTPDNATGYYLKEELR